VILVISVIVVRLSVGFGLYPRIGAEAIWWGFIASAVAAAVMAVVYYLHGGWRRGAPVTSGAGL
jgi:Na+-driven multidrug efflux pump